MSVKWTENQIKAINSSGNNILVSAAAGSGKTAVLVERVIRMITDNENPVSIDKILMVTFTNAAAAEMKTRIYKAIKNCIENDPLNSRLYEQLSLLGQAQISTIHSFCQNLLKDNFYKVGISPDFAIIDKVDEAELKLKVVEQVVEEGYALYPDQVDALISMYGGRFDDSKLKSMITELYNFVQSQPDPLSWLTEMTEMYHQNFADTKWAEFILTSAKKDLKEALKYYDYALEIAENGGVDSYIGLLSAEIKMLEEALPKLTDWDSAKELFDSFEFKRLPNKTKGCDEICAAASKTYRDSAKTIIKDIGEFLCETNENITKENNNQYEILNCYKQLVLRFSEIYMEKKSELNCFDFNDLLHITLNELLSDEEYLEQLRDKYDEILVDEFQDTNAVNVAIFEKLSKGNNLFMVGDVKQSIYGFINAMPESFIERYESYSVDGNESGQKISLSNNFRSAENVLEFSNSLFKKLMTKETGGIDYSDDQKLVYSNKEVSTSLPVEVHLLETKDEEGIYPENDKLSNEAYFVAKRILSLVEIEKPLIYDDKIKADRPIKYSDIAILARSVKGDIAVEFTKNLAMFGIPVTCDETGSYLMTVEILTVISFLKLIDNPCQDIPMLAVMRSPMFAFTENELAEIKAEHPKAPFFKAVFLNESQKVSVFLKALNEYIEISKTESIEFLIEKILSDTGYYSFVGILPDGKQRMANLKLLSTRANMFEKQGRKSIYEYINYINSMLENGNEYNTARTLSDVDNVVRVMTIHKSKGLEFPAVFLALCGKKLQHKGGGNQKCPTLMNGEMGIGIDYIDGMVKYPSVPMSVIKKYKQNKDLAEEIRVLYVALTRAKNFLCITGSCDNAQEKLDTLSETAIDRFFINKAQSTLDWIVAGTHGKCVAKAHSIEEVLSDAPYVELKLDATKKECDITETNASLNLSYSYKYKDLKNLPSKVSVSELVSDNVVPRLNKISDSINTISKANKGTIIHFVMQALDFSKTSYEEIKNQLELMLNKNMLTKEQYDVVGALSIAEFFKTDMGRRVKEATKVYKEYSFCTEITADELYENVNSKENILVQGTVDCFFIENNEIVILDYKTGYVNDNYQKQVDIYSKCIEKIFKLPVKEAKLISLM